MFLFKNRIPVIKIDLEKQEKQYKKNKNNIRKDKTNKTKEIKYESKRITRKPLETFVFSRSYGNFKNLWKLPHFHRKLDVQDSSCP